MKAFSLLIPLFCLLLGCDKSEKEEVRDLDEMVQSEETADRELTAHAQGEIPEQSTQEVLIKVNPAQN